ncbi:MAG: hypothetical protein GY943_02760 [Chloroflexi bacterium]|nr:hypothetical protein [Chloroflexota bacterium]
MSSLPIRRVFTVILFLVVFSIALILMSLSAHSQTVQHVPEPYMLADIHVETMFANGVAAGNGNSYPTDFTNADGTVFMFANDENGRGLFINNGPQDGAHFVAEVNPNDNSTYPPPMPTPYATPAANFGRPTAINDKFFYVNDDGSTGRELWVSDGSLTGTMLVKDITLGSNSYPGSLKSFNDQLIFQAGDIFSNSKLWITDGTITNTEVLYDNVSGEDYSYPHNLVTLNNVTYFRANHEILGDSIWRTDGTPDGTRMAVDVLPTDSSNSYYDDYVTLAGDLLYFLVNHPSYGKEFWRSDGTVDGTWLVKDIAPGTSNSTWQTKYIDFNNTFYFYADHNDAYGRELWQTDGSMDNAILVKDINLDSGDSYVNRLAVVNGRIFFTAIDATHGRELWISDGTENGTDMVTDINLNGSSILGKDYYQDYAAMNGLYFFAAYDGVHGIELWQSDGTEAGTVMVMDINPGAGSSNPKYFEVIDNTLYFSADDGTHGVEPWVLSHAAFARDDSVITVMGKAITINVIENDNYLNLDQIVITKLSDPEHGVVVLNNTTFTYTPDNGYVGSDWFTYTISDGSGEPKLATVTILINGERLYLPLILQKEMN